MSKKERENEELLSPDYFGHPEDDEPLEEIDETNEDARIERILNEQEEEKKKMDTPFTGGTGFPTFGSSGGVGTGSQKAPWEKANETRSPGSGWGSSWGIGGSSGSSYGGSRETAPWNTSQGRNEPQIDYTVNTRPKKVVVCDVLDCLVESYDSNGKPGIIPRAIFDLKPKFNVWERLASFNPEKLYIIFPSHKLIPSFGDRASSEIALDYIAYGISTYLRIPRHNCSILKQMELYVPKDRILSSVLSGWPNPEEIVYIGIHSGRWGLSSRDKDAAKTVGIDYIDIFELINGYYKYE